MQSIEEHHELIRGGSHLVSTWICEVVFPAASVMGMLRHSIVGLEVGYSVLFFFVHE